MTKPSNAYLAHGSVSSDLAKQVSEILKLPLHNDEIKAFPSGERYFRYAESVRGKHVLILQSLAQTGSTSVNDALVELVIMIDAARRGSAAEITVVSPYLAYMRQDRKAKGREPISAAATINLLQATGAHRLVSIDMHSAQSQGVFDGPFDHLTAEPLIFEALRKRISVNTDQFIIVSPDGGRAKTAEMYAELLGLQVVHIPKTRDKDDSSVLKRPDVIEGARQKWCILIDDLIDTAGTLLTAAETLRSSGSLGVIAAATHGLLSGPALERLQSSAITELYITDTVPVETTKDRLGDMLTVIPCAPMLAAALEAIVSGGSVSHIFKGRNYY